MRKLRSAKGISRDSFRGRRCRGCADVQGRDEVGARCASSAPPKLTLGRAFEASAVEGVLTATA